MTIIMFGLCKLMGIRSLATDN